MEPSFFEIPGSPEKTRQSRRAATRMNRPRMDTDERVQPTKDAMSKPRNTPITQKGTKAAKTRSLTANHSDLRIAGLARSGRQGIFREQTRDLEGGTSPRLTATEAILRCRLITEVCDS